MPTHDEQRVRTMAGWIGVEISRSRVRTAGKAGFGLYRVRPTPRSTDLPEDLDEMWTAYAFTLEAIERSVRNAIGRGRPAAPGTMCIAGAGHAKALPTRWTSAYRGRRDLGCGGVEGELAGWDEMRGPAVGANSAGTVRSRQRAENAAFQEQHLKERAWGLEQRHAAKLARGRTNGGESAPSAR